MKLNRNFCSLVSLFLLEFLSVFIPIPTCLNAETANSTNSPHFTAFYNGQEYTFKTLEKILESETIPPDLQAYPQPGDHCGIRRYEDNNLVQELFGSVTADKRVVFPNGDEFSLRAFDIRDYSSEPVEIDLTIRDVIARLCKYFPVIYKATVDEYTIVKNIVREKYKDKTEGFIEKNVDELNTFGWLNSPIRKHRMFLFYYEDEETYSRREPALSKAVIIALRNKDKQPIILGNNLPGLESFIREEGWVIGSNITLEKFLEEFIRLFGESLPGWLLTSVEEIPLTKREKFSKEVAEFISNYKDKISPPKMTRNPAGSEIEFWTCAKTWNANTYTNAIFKWRINISDDYKISYEQLAKEDISDIRAGHHE